MSDITRREVGWLITRDYDVKSDSNRLGWGQLRIHAQETEASFDRFHGGRTVFMDKSLTEHMIPEYERVRWRAFDDDGLPMFDGIVSIRWIYPIDEEDLAFNIDRFCEADAGATRVMYSLDDMFRATLMLQQTDWNKHVSLAKAESIIGEPGRWTQIYC